MDKATFTKQVTEMDRESLETMILELGFLATNPEVKDGLPATEMNDEGYYWPETSLEALRAVILANWTDAQIADLPEDQDLSDWSL